MHGDENAAHRKRFSSQAQAAVAAQAPALAAVAAAVRRRGRIKVAVTPAPVACDCEKRHSPPLLNSFMDQCTGLHIFICVHTTE